MAGQQGPRRHLRLLAHAAGLPDDGPRLLAGALHALRHSGIAQGAFFAALFTLVIRRSESVDENRQTTAIIQTTGYCLAAVGPVVMGWVHERSGGWVAPFSMVVGVLVLMSVCAQIAAHAGDSAGRPEPSIPAGVLRGDDGQAERGGDR